LSRQMQKVRLKKGQKVFAEMSQEYYERAVEKL